MNIITITALYADGEEIVVLTNDAREAARITRELESLGSCIVVCEFDCEGQHIMLGSFPNDEG